ncbi:MAG: LytR family transcriptional regulator [Chloroflexi bacterium]|nr:LytR family transcriptional regulator [Chloroflexota bacterium]
MTSRVEDTRFAAFPERRRARRRARTAPRVTGAQRFLFVLALFTFGLASMYTSVALLARVTPALFPGKSLTNLGIIKPLAKLDTPLVTIKDPGANSVFNERINLLVLGVDKRPGYQFEDNENSGYLTDTIMVATIDPVADTVSVLSFPRDMQIDIHTKDFVYEDRINTSYGIGVRATGSIKGGVEQLKLDMKENFGIEIKHYVILDFEGVEGLVDAIGGVEVDIPYDLSVPDWYYSNDDVNAMWVRFPPGVNRLDGYHAVAFGRHREYDSDLKRVKRQQLVLEAAMRKAFTLGLLNKNPKDLWDAYAGAVKTDVPYSKFPGYAFALRDTNGKLKTYSLGDPVNDVPTMTPFTTNGGASVLLWNAENVQYWLNQVFTKAAYAEASVEIQNGYGEDGSVRAAALGRYLAYVKGLPTVYYGPDVAVQPRTSVTLYGEGKRDLAEDIAKWMCIDPSAVVVLAKTDTSLPDVVITIGKDFKVPGG